MLAVGRILQHITLYQQYKIYILYILVYTVLYVLVGRDRYTYTVRFESFGTKNQRLAMTTVL